jgi:mono/diheme cytochrome c family protein
MLLKDYSMKIFTSLVTATLLLFSFDKASAKSHNKEALAKKDIGKKLYIKNCAMCHHKDRVGLEGPPLFDKTLKRYRNRKKLAQKIQNGFPQTLMPEFYHLSEKERLAIVNYIKRPLDKNITLTKTDIERSIKLFDNPKKELNITDINNITPVVERDGGKIWIMQDDKILDKFPLKNVHGGIKYKFPEVDSIFIPTRDGYVVKYSLKNGRVEGQIRACINLRNISISRDGKNLFITCLLPKQIIVTDTEDFKIKKMAKLKGKISALYELYTKEIDQKLYL